MAKAVELERPSMELGVAGGCAHAYKSCGRSRHGSNQRSQERELQIALSMVQNCFSPSFERMVSVLDFHRCLPDAVIRLRIV